MTTTILINSKLLGGGDNEKLGIQLMGSFLRKIWMIEKKPETIIFYNTGVHLLSEESPVLDALDALSRLGVDLVACGTCVDFFDLSNKIRIGRVSNMEEIVSILMSSSTVITP